jgi:hypothetical protein
MEHALSTRREVKRRRFRIIGAHFGLFVALEAGKVV